MAKLLKKWMQFNIHIFQNFRAQNISRIFISDQIYCKYTVNKLLIYNEYTVNMLCFYNEYTVNMLLIYTNIL